MIKLVVATADGQTALNALAVLSQKLLTWLKSAEAFNCGIKNAANALSRLPVRETLTAFLTTMMVILMLVSSTLTLITGINAIVVLLHAR